MLQTAETFTPTLADMAHYFIITITTGLLVVITLLLSLVFLEQSPRPYAPWRSR
jgi:hypothetical protein